MKSLIINYMGSYKRGYRSLSRRIIIVFTGLIIISLLIISFFLGISTRNQLLEVLDENSRNILESTFIHIENLNRSTSYFRETMTERRKIEAQNNSLLGWKIIENNWNLYQEGRLGEEEARERAIACLSEMRINDPGGFFWIMDTAEPVPLLVFHPNYPELNGTPIDRLDNTNPSINGKKIYTDIIRIAQEEGEGFLSYTWPHQDEENYPEYIDRLSYIRYFAPWDLVIITGLYLDDIEQGITRQQEVVIENLNQLIPQQKIGESGYIIIFNRDFRILVHPNIAGTEGRNLINPATGEPLLDELIKSVQKNEGYHEYLWDKPGFEGEYRFKKQAYTVYHEELGWYICSTVYQDDAALRLAKLLQSMGFISTMFIIFTFLVSLFVSRDLSGQLTRVIEAIRVTDASGLPHEAIPDSSYRELHILGSAINTMVDSVKSSKKALEESQNRSKLILSIIPDLLFIMNREGVFLDYESMNREFFISEDFHAKSISEIMPSDIADLTIKKIRETLEKGIVNEFFYSLSLPEGDTEFFEARMVPAGGDKVFAMVRDVTEKKRMEEIMVQSEKMLSVGGLAAGMAHEINNPLAGLLQTANVLSSRLQDSELSANRSAAEKAGIDLGALNIYMNDRGIFRMLTDITESGSRISDIVDNMLSFARKSDDSVSTYDITELMDRTLELAATDFDLKKHYDFKKIEIKKEYQKDLPQIPCQPGKIQQVLLNLLSNSAQALQSKTVSRPTMVLRLYQKTAEGNLVIEIEDNGPGVAEEIRNRIFEPFFTTKPVGTGTGLGLSVSYFIIRENHGGDMKVENAPGGGALFVITLPLEREAG